MKLPFQTYDADKLGLSSVYHKSQKNIWNGKDVLLELINLHSLNISPEHKNSLIKILGLITYGEYAAWQVSSNLTYEIQDFEAKMAATSQVFDEARHFYTICDYLKKVLDFEPNNLTLSLAAQRGFENILQTESLAKKLLGMQLMVEPVAITIFHALRNSRIEPILADLLEYYIVDEARHIALGTKYLPEEIKKLSYPNIISLFVWQSNILKLEIDGLFDLKDDFKCLGIDYLEIFKVAEKKQIEAAQELFKELKWDISIEQKIKFITRNYLQLKMLLSGESLFSGI